ncbi:glycosyltransferase [Arenibaculum pallidiluteum]|uniref:glycosyltransferase n=1 Tax=Arenibaculum pallidiluteum TaxID=2812559 RepID=UPI001A962473|nr:glycosyltransferase [Arenibaculum pallidiluteum]
MRQALNTLPPRDLPTSEALAADAPRLRVLSLSTVFPNPGAPLHGLFVQERLRHLAAHADIRVVAPVARFPWRPHSTVTAERRAGLPVAHPTFRYVPGILKATDGFALAISALPTVRRLMRETGGFDLIDAHFAYPEGFAAALLGRWLGLPVVMTERGTLPMIWEDPLRGRAARWGLRQADRVIAVAEPLAALARAAGVPGERVSVIENGVDAARFHPRDKAEARRAVGCGHAGPLLVSVGHLSPRKGFHRVLDVLPELLRDVPDLAFAIVGGPGKEGDNSADLARRIAERGLERHVIMAGPQSPEGVADWLAAADVFVLASDLEGCPNVVWEAMACARPVVASRVGHVGHMVPDFAGIVFGDAEDRAALQTALAQALQRPWDPARIRAHAEAHTWEGVAERVLAQWRLAAGLSAERR